MDKISIIVPIYNAEKYLDRCIASIMSQDYDNLEIILVNDGSTDESANIIKKYEKKDKRIKVINKINSGVSNTRNVGIANSSGKYISFIDADDYIEKNMISKMYNIIKKEKVDVVRCKAFMHDQNQIMVEEERIKLIGKYNSQEIKNNLTYFLSQKNPINCYVWSLLIDKKVIPTFNEDLSFMEDTEFYLKLFNNLKSIFFLDCPLYHYMYTSTGITKNIKNCFKNIRRLYESYDAIYRFLKENKYPNCDSLSKELKIKIFNSTINQIKSTVKKEKIGYIRIELQKTITKPLREKILDLEYKKLNTNKKIAYIFIKHNKYTALILFLRLCGILKK